MSGRNVVGLLAVLLLVPAVPVEGQGDTAGQLPIGDFGDDSSPYANDGDCDDTRFSGDRGSSAWTASDEHVGRDATDCRIRLIAGLISWREAPAIAPRVVLDALPDSRVIASAVELREREVLTLATREQNRVTIVWDGENYRWASRENRVLISNPPRSGIFHVFVDPTGGGWIKVLDQRELPDLLRLDGPDVQFYESVSDGLTVLTYWGSSPRRWVP